MKTISNLSDFQVIDREQCGVLIETQKEIRVVELENYHPSPESYAIRILDVENAKRNLMFGEAFIGFFHTHLKHHDPQPSDEDFDGAHKFPDMQNCVYQPATGSLIWYGNLTEVT